MPLCASYMNTYRISSIGQMCTVVMTSCSYDHYENQVKFAVLSERLSEIPFAPGVLASLPERTANLTCFFIAVLAGTLYCHNLCDGQRSKHSVFVCLLSSNNRESWKTIAKFLRPN